MCDYFTFALLFFNANGVRKKKFDVNNSLESNTAVHIENNGAYKGIYDPAVPLFYDRCHSESHLTLETDPTIRKTLNFRYQWSYQKFEMDHYFLYIRTREKSAIIIPYWHLIVDHKNENKMDFETNVTYHLLNNHISYIKFLF